jgi:hypothetical protein
MKTTNQVEIQRYEHLKYGDTQFKPGDACEELPGKDILWFSRTHWKNVFYVCTPTGRRRRTCIEYGDGSRCCTWEPEYECHEVPYPPYD